MNSDFDELLKTFNDSEIKYLIVGGHAVMLYTEPRYTKDRWKPAPKTRTGSLAPLRALVRRWPAFPPRTLPAKASSTDGNASGPG